MDTVPYTRREFLETVSAATALSGVSCGAEVEVGEDPLGVRRDFPVVGESTYLDSAYITPSPRPAVEAAQAFAEAKAHEPVSRGDMMAESNLVRQRFAQLVGASESEVGLLFATSEGGEHCCACARPRTG